MATAKENAAEDAATEGTTTKRSKKTTTAATEETTVTTDPNPSNETAKPEGETAQSSDSGANATDVVTDPKGPEVVAPTVPNEEIKPEAETAQSSDSGANAALNPYDAEKKETDPLSLTVINNGASYYEMALKKNILPGKNIIKCKSFGQRRTVVRNLSAINGLQSGKRFVIDVG